MSKYGFDGLEIAPTKVFPEKPYDNLHAVKAWADNIKVASRIMRIWVCSL